jgi:glycosyltransferase involved in cell wall biosynthesis
MRILLVGEYSRLQNTLKEGLTALGHEVLLVGTQDGFKNYPVDFNYQSVLFTNPILKPIVKLILKLTSINLIHFENAYRFNKKVDQLRDFDVVQLINETSIKTTSNLEIKLLKKILETNKKLFLLSCGTDRISVKYAMNKNLRYSILTPMHENPVLKKYYKFILKYLSDSHRVLHEFIYEHMNGVISTDIDYHLPLIGHERYLGLIPDPVNIDKIECEPLTIDGKIVIFHGINTNNYIKKGNRYFEEALSIIAQKYQNKVVIVTVRDQPYDIYIKHYDNAHILLDQVFSFDQGYNALEAMAKGKVVFTGAEREWLEFFNIEEDTIAINAVPDVGKIVSKLEWLILNPNKILQISKNARTFIEKEHNYIKIAQEYLNKWTSN